MSDKKQHGVTNKHKQYGVASPKWIECRDVIAGEEAVKAGGTKYLPKPSGQDSADYEGYKSRAMFYGATKRTVNGLTGQVTSPTPTFTVPDSIAGYQRDMTLAGETFDAMLATCVREVLSVGRFGLLVDFSAETNRPFVLPFKAEAICNWATTYREGDTVLTMLVLQESEEKSSPDGFGVITAERYRVYRVEWRGESRVVTSQVYMQDDKGEWVAGEVTVPTRTGQPLTAIPFVFFGPDGINTPDVADPPVHDLVKVNLSHYRTSADLEHGRHFCGLPQPVISGATLDSVKVGSASALILPEPGAKAGYMEFTGQGLQPLREAMQDKESYMQVLGSRLLEPQAMANETFGAVRLRHAGDTSVLQNIVASVNSGMTAVVRLMAWWAGAVTDPDDQSIEASLAPVLAPTPMLNLNELLMAVEAGRMSYATYYWNLERHGLTRPGVTADAERQSIAAEGGIDPVMDPLDVTITE